MRKATMIAPAEYHLAIMATLAEVVAISRAELLVETAGLFGFDRTGPDLKHEISCQTAELIRKAHIIEDGDMLRIRRD
jgi:hypothetical protein